MFDPRGPSPMMHAPRLKFAGEDGRSAGSATISRAPGLLFLFPSFLLHAVRPYTGNSLRISIAFNLGCIRTHEGREERQARGLMRVTFRCDPALIDTLARPIPAASLARMAQQYARHRLVRAAWRGRPHGQALPALCRRDGLRLCYPASLPMSRCVTACCRGIGNCRSCRRKRTRGHRLSFHVPAQVTATPFHERRNIHREVQLLDRRVEPGYSLFATYPVNRADLPFRLLSGLVDCDRFSDVGVLFPAVWTDPDFLRRVALVARRVGTVSR